jgi:hypothetical protein
MKKRKRTKAVEERKRYRELRQVQGRPVRNLVREVLKRAWKNRVQEACSAELCQGQFKLGLANLAIRVPNQLNSFN